MRRASLRSMNLLWWVLLWVVVSPLKVTSQPPGFISIDCGGSQRYVDQNDVTWDTDDGYITTGFNKALSPQNNYKNFNWNAVQSVRHFPDRKKNCYVMPTVDKNRYLIRVLFYFANFKALPPGPSYRFNVSVDANLWRTILLTNGTTKDLLYEEIIVSAQGSTLSVCLIDIGDGEPFISSLELRPLNDLYAEMAGDNFLFLLHRFDCSGYEEPPIRYPDDSFDRFWRRHDNYGLPSNTNPDYPIRNISTNATPEKTYVEYPPVRVMNTAWSETELKFRMIAGPSEKSTELNTSSFLSMFHIWDFQPNVPGAGDYFIFMDDEKLFDVKTGDNKLFWKNHTRNSKQDFIDSDWRISSTSTNGAILNAAEFYAIYPRASSTNRADVTAVSDLQDLYLITETYPAWTGDPCQPVPWDWIHCDISTDPPRVTQVNLSHVFNEYNNSALTLPSTFRNLTELTHFSLNNNNLSGQIPDLSFLTKLQVLHLDGNRLTGTIPGYLAQLPDLSELYLQRNNLSGSIPNDLKKPGLKLRAGCNPLLQGYSLTSDIDDSCNATSSKAKDKNNISNLYTLIFVVGGALVGGLSLFLICTLRNYYLRRKGKITPSHSGSKLKPRKNHSRPFELEEVKSATNNFDSTRLIGKGGFGSVYYGSLDDGSEVAVKVRSETSHQGPDEFYNEVDLLSRVHHRNLVPLVGYCQADIQQILIYPFMPGKTLQDHLCGPESLLGWHQRLDIALDAARGLCYLHKDCSPTIVHRDVKSSNILLDNQLRAKLSDFGISRSIEGNTTGFEATTRVIGSLGYLDPEYSATQRLTLKSDVYSFGVVLLEIITGRPPINSHGPIDRAHWHLIDWAQELIESGDVTKMVDPILEGSYSPEAMLKVATLALQSVEPTSSKRISMEAVVTGLTEVLTMERLCFPPRDPPREEDLLDSQTFSLMDSTMSSDHWPDV